MKKEQSGEQPIKRDKFLFLTLNRPEIKETKEIKMLQKGTKIFFDFYSSYGELSLKDFLEKLEREIIMEALTRLNGNQKMAAKVLGLKHTTLHMKARKYNISFYKWPYFGPIRNVRRKKGARKSSIPISSSLSNCVT